MKRVRDHCLSNLLGEQCPLSRSGNEPDVHAGQDVQDAREDTRHQDGIATDQYSARKKDVPVLPTLSAATFAHW